MFDLYYSTLYVITKIADKIKISEKLAFSLISIITIVLCILSWAIAFIFIYICINYDMSLVDIIFMAIIFSVTIVASFIAANFIMENQISK